MKEWFQHFRKRWTDWAGDREMEVKILGALKRRGLNTHHVKLEEVQLVAIERPGWVQIYAFQCVEGRNAVFGMARMDERYVDHVEIFEDRESRDDAVLAAAEGFIIHRRWRR